MAGGEPHEERLLATVGGAVIDGARVGLAGSWDGHAEAYGFAPDGSDRVRLVIAANGLGSLQVGNSAPLAQPLDPDVGYPPATDLPDSSGLWEGFLYPIHSVQISADRIQLGIDANDVFAAWCALQTSYPLWQYQDTPDGAVQTAYGCVAHGLQFGFEPIAPPDGGADAGAGCVLTDADGGASIPIDCERPSLCVQGNVCLCTATSCVSRSIAASTPSLSYPIDLDASLDTTGATLTGTLVLGGTRVVIHLQRQ